MLEHLQRRAILMSSILVIGIVLSATPVGADNLNDAIKQQQELIQKQNSAQGQLNNLTIKENQMTKQIQQLTVDISKAEIDLETKENEFTKVQAEVEAVQQEVDQKKEELENRQDTMRKRMRSIYEDGQVNYMEVLFQSTNISDFICRMEYVGCLVDNDQKLLDDLKSQKSQLDEKEKELLAKMAEAKKLKEEAVAAKAYLDDKKSSKEIALVDNEQSQEAILEQIAKMENDSKNLEEKIRQLQSQNTGIVGSVTTWPTPSCRYITSPFGYRIHPTTGKYTLHTGVDIGASYGATIVSAGSGIVIFSGWYGAYGNAIIIDHGNGVSTLYGHMSSIVAKVKTAVVPGQTIGYVGTTGWSTGPHLHFEVRVNGTPVNPLQYYN
ncbi:MAG: peptidoglycan DD-metalloendopeptidase family protein [Eubacteriales bacterium]